MNPQLVASITYFTINFNLRVLIYNFDAIQNLWDDLRLFAVAAAKEIDPKLNLATETPANYPKIN